jgi:hypothetical protein
MCAAQMDLRTTILLHQFKVNYCRRFKPSSFQYDDEAPMPRQSTVEDCNSIVSQFLIIGAFPWENDSEPRVL